MLVVKINACNTFYIRTEFVFLCSDELLLQEDNHDVSSLSLGMSNGMRLGNAMEPATLTSGVIRLGHISNQASTSSSSRLSNQRYVTTFSEKLTLWWHINLVFSLT